MVVWRSAPLARTASRSRRRQRARSKAALLPARRERQERRQSNASSYSSSSTVIGKRQGGRVASPLDAGHADARDCAGDAEVNEIDAIGRRGQESGENGYIPLTARAVDRARHGGEDRKS